MTEEPETQLDSEAELSAGDLVAAAPGLARLAAGAAWRTTLWSATIGARASNRVVQAARTGESVGDLFIRAENELIGYLRGLGEIIESEVETGRANGRANGASADGTPPDSAEELRERGAELLRLSAEVEDHEESHPAYGRILEALAPDEARILRLLALEGPQPSVDVRSGLPINVGSELIAPGLSMIGAEAGCTHTERVQAYLNNLFRLGLIWFSREPVTDPTRYQVLEAQPDVTDALRRGGRLSRTVRRSVQLTPFGQDFCSTCLPLDTAEFGALGRTEGGEVKVPGRIV